VSSKDPLSVNGHQAAWGIGDPQLSMDQHSALLLGGGM